MTKKKQKEQNSKQRGTWFGVNPQTRVVPDKKKQFDKNKCRKTIDFS